MQQSLSDGRELNRKTQLNRKNMSLAQIRYGEFVPILFRQSYRCDNET